MGRQSYNILTPSHGSAATSMLPDSTIKTEFIKLSIFVNNDKYHPRIEQKRVKKGTNKPEDQKVTTSQGTRHFQSSHLGYFARTPNIYVDAYIEKDLIMYVYRTIVSYKMIHVLV